MRRAITSPLLLLLIVALAAFSACDDTTEDDAASGSGTAADAPLQVVATTPLLAEFVEQVATQAPGAVDITSIVAPGADAHSVQPSPAIARSVAEADLLIVNGYDLEEGLLSVVSENRRAETPVIVAAATAAEAALIAESEEMPALATAEGDPHRWLDVRLAAGYVSRIAEGLIAADPEHAEQYRAGADVYLETLDALDAEVRERIAAVPAAERVLVVFHDAFTFFAEAYGLELIATVHAHSPTHEASAHDVADVVEAVRDRQVPVIFAEPQFSRDAIELVASESGARVADIYSVPIPEVAPDYVTTMRLNADAIGLLALAEAAP